MSPLIHRSLILKPSQDTAGIPRSISSLQDKIYPDHSLYLDKLVLHLPLVENS